MTTTLREPCCGSIYTVTTMKAVADAFVVSDSQLEEQYSASDSRFIGTTVDFRRGYALADRIYALHEPWRSRFVALIAQRVNATVTTERLPSRTQIAVWLSDRQLARLIGLMVRAWTCADL